jgi:hypothetical protein
MSYTTYFDRYKELRQQYKILKTYEPVTDYDDWDVIIQPLGPGYAHAKYRIVKNAPNLTPQELAIICDEGNLCFGFRAEGGTIYVYTD